MTIHRRVSTALIPQAATGLFVVIFVLAVALLVRHTFAYFERPNIEVNNFISTTEFRNVWGFHRTQETCNVAAHSSECSGTVYNAYQAFAVGINRAVTTNPDTTNGLIYFYNGTSWRRLISSDIPTYTLNAVAGQHNVGAGSAKIIVGGANMKMHQINYLFHSPGDPALCAGCESSQFAPLTVYEWGTATPVTNEQRDIYSIDVVKTYAGQGLAGGEGGLILQSNSVETGNWYRRSVPALTVNDHVTDIIISGYDTAYVITSTFDPGSPARVGSIPHVDRTCLNESEQTGRLWKVRLSTWQWTELKNQPTCFYGVTAGLRNQAPANGGPYQQVIWVATARGIYRYDENTGSGNYVPGSQVGNRKVFDVTAIEDKGGTGQNLLTNGNFESWLTTGGSPNVNDINIHPSGWLLNEFDARDVTIAADDTPGDDSDGRYAIRIKPQQPYDCLGTGCENNSSRVYQTNFGVIGRVPLSTIEGQKFRITGRVKVEFLPEDQWVQDVNNIDEGLLAAYARMAGGVTVTCEGTVPRKNYFPQAPDCSVQNRSAMRVFQQGNTNGFVPFEIITSRQDNQFTNLRVRQSTLPRSYLSKEGAILTVKCEATVGATVWCDDLQVEEISDPPVPSREEYTVIGAGQAGLLLTNPSAMNPASRFNEEHRTGTVTPEDFHSITSMGLQHVYVVGANATIASRTPSTLAGYIWAGTASPPGAGGSALGWISTSCLNSKVGNTTLCRRSPESYGLSQEADRLTGRAWFGKMTAVSASDEERLDLGACINDEQLAGTPPGNPSRPFDLTGMCDTLFRRCKANRNAQGSISNRYCETDFDCYGKCEFDQGFLCVSDGDCRLNGTSATNISSSTGNLSVPPSSRLKCSPDSPLACTGGGWLTFNDEDFPASLPVSQRTPPGGAPGDRVGVDYNKLFPTHNSAFPTPGHHELNGWGRFISLANVDTNGDPNKATGYCATSASNISDRGKGCLTNSDCSDVAGSFCVQGSGWVRFRAPEGSGTAPTELFGGKDCVGTADNMTCAFAQDGKHQSCRPAAQSCTYRCELNGNPCAVASDCTATNGGRCLQPGRCEKSPATLCQTDAECGSNGPCVFGATCEAAGASCVAYGVNLSTESGRYSGYAWSPDYGWLDFRYVTPSQARFLQTRLGDIYARGSIGGAGLTIPTNENCNGSFRIISSTSISGFCSYLQQTGTLPSGVNLQKEDEPAIAFGQQSNLYRNILGRFDLVGIETATGGNKNKYGADIVSLPAVGAANDLSANLNTRLVSNGGALGGRVLIASGATDYIINSPVAIENSANLSSEKSGAGMLIVNGNLTINAPISYAAGPVDDLRKLASLVVVVNGNLTIGSGVRDLVGSYYVIDNPATDDGNPTTTSDVEGTIFTSTPADSEGFPLEVRGLMIAKNFVFRRRHAGTVENPAPSELIIYDGRVQSNPMPGMVDFANALPSSVDAP